MGVFVGTSPDESTTGQEPNRITIQCTLGSDRFGRVVISTPSPVSTDNGSRCRSVLFRLLTEGGTKE